MKKLVALTLALSLLLACVPAGGLAAGKTFTLMVYMCGTDLESDGGMASADLYEMVQSGVKADGNLTVLVQTGGTKDWQTSGLSNRKVERWLLSEQGIQLVDSVGSADMGDANTLYDFLQFGLDNCAADRYGLILWDHGAGASGGVCNDEMSEDCLYMSEIYDSLNKASKHDNFSKFAFIGFDACLMATYEMACTLEPFADYMIGSEELEPGTGWSYTGWLPTLASDPGVDIEKLGKLLVDSFVTDTLKNDPSEYATLAMLDLNNMPALRQAVEDMGAALGGQITAGNLTGISRVRQNVRSFGEAFDYASDMIDMTVFADAYSQYDKASAKAIKAALKDVVVCNRYSSNLSNVSGMSVLVPYATKRYASTYMPYYDQQGISPQYTAFVSAMLEQMSGNSFSFSSASVQQESMQQAQVDWFSQYCGDSQSYYDCSDEWLSSCDEGSDSFSLDGFLNALFGSGGDCGSSFEESGSTSLWGDMDDEADTSFIANNQVTGSVFEGLWSTEPAPAATVEVQTDNGTVALDNPFAGNDSEYAYTVTLSQEEMQYLAKAEANLMMDVSDDDGDFYVELGYVSDVLIDWDQGKIYGLFDGTWPCLDNQMVCMYNQVSNDKYIRALIPAKINDVEQYLLVVFDESNPKGYVVGYNAGYTDAGTPARGYTKLEQGDVVVPQYDLLYWDAEGEQQTEPFEGDPIEAGEDGYIAFSYQPVEAGADYAYGFCLDDIFGDYQFTDFVTFSY